MKILMLTTHVNMGGISRYLYILSKGLIARGHDVRLISSGGDMSARFEQLGVKLITMDIRTKSALSPKLYAALGPIERTIREGQTDVVHAQTRVTQVMGHWLQKRTGVAYVSTCHGYFKAKLSRRLFPCWGEVIAISEPVLVHLQKDFRVAKNKSHLVRHGIELEEFPEVFLEERSALRKKLGVGDGPFIGMLARLSGVKGQDILLRAIPKVIQAVGDVKLLLFGEGKTKPELERIIDELKLNGQVRFFPVIDRTRESLSVLDICIVPSRQEGLGLSVMEAQACAVAVIASRVGGIVSLIEDGINGILVEPHNSDALAAAIIALLKDDAKRRSIALAAREHAFKDYSAATMVDKTIKVYEHAISKRRP